MKPENENTNLDELISKAIGDKKLAFNFQQWKKDHPKQVADYKEQTASKSHKLIRYAGILSAAAMILLAVMLLPTISDNDAQPVEYQAKILTAKISLPADVPTIAKLNIIFQKYDMQAVDTFCEQAANRTGLQPEKMTARQLLKEMETNSDNTEGNDHENRSYNNTDDMHNAA